MQKHIQATADENCFPFAYSTAYRQYEYGCLLLICIAASMCNSSDLYTAYVLWYDIRTTERRFANAGISIRYTAAY